MKISSEIVVIESFMFFCRLVDRTNVQGEEIL